METVQEGWGDDDDLLSSDDSLENDTLRKQMLGDAAVGMYKGSMNKGNINKGIINKGSIKEGSGHSFASWDYDDAFSQSTEGAQSDQLQHVSPVSKLQPPAALLFSNHDSEEEDDDGNVGWEDDADLGLDHVGDESENAAAPVVVATAADLPYQSRTQTKTVDESACSNKSAEEVENGWDDDDDLNLDDDNVDNDQALERGKVEDENNWTDSRSATSVEEPVNGSGWDDEFDLDNDDDEPPLPTSQHKQPARQISRLHTDLEIYLDQLGHLQSSINAILQYEYNTPEKAKELVHYYQQRPGLVKYTVEKELPRMDYTAIVDHNATITDKAIIASIMQSHGDNDYRSLLSRCANQSLLADLLQVCTGPDLLVRPQYHATAMAQAVHFIVNYTTQTVSAHATLDLSLPTEQGRWKVAQVEASIVLSHGKQQSSQKQREPAVHYAIQAIRPVARDEQWMASLDSAVGLLMSLSPDEHLQDDMPQSQNTSSNGLEDFRDLFLQQSQNLLQHSTLGMKAAWQDIDAVTGLGRKLNKIPAFLPDHLTAAAEQEQHAAAMHHQQSAGAARPTSILGGLVRSGLSKLAQTVALPDEDPSLYQTWQQQQQSGGPRPPPAAVPRLFQRPIEEQQPVSAVPRLYNRPDEKQSAVAPEVPRLYNRPEEQKRPPAAEVPRLYKRPEEQQLRPNEAPHPQHPRGGTPSQPNLSSHNFPPTMTTMLPNVATMNRKPEHHEKPAPKISHTLDTIVVDDGWDDDDNDLVFEDTTAEAAEVPSVRHDLISHTIAHQALLNNAAKDEAAILQHLGDDWVYNPEDDIIPTRKRWVNPLPGIRKLSV